MNHDHTFQAALIAFFVMVLPIGAYYRLTSQATREKLDRRQLDRRLREPRDG